MEQNETTLQDYLAVISRRRPQLITTFSLLLLVTIGIGFGLPPIYQSKATILIEKQEIPQDLVRSTVTSFADQQIQVISQRVMTSTNLTDIIRKYDLYSNERRTKPMEVVIDKMRDDINMDTVSADVVNPTNGQAQKATIAFTLSYENRSPELAQRVTNELVSLYLNENLKSRTESAKGTSTFLGDEADKLKARVDELDARLAEYKENNVNALPEMMSFNLESLDAVRRELQDTENQLRADQQKNIYLESQLAQTKPYTQLYSETGERILSPSDRLKALQSQYITLKARYSPEYPDVVSIKKEIDALKKHVDSGESRSALEVKLEGLRADLVTARKRYTDSHPDVKKLEREISEIQTQLADMPSTSQKMPIVDPDNPTYVQLKADLDASENDLQVLSKRRDQLHGKVEDLEQRILAAPQVEKKYRELSRDVEAAQAQYNDLLAKRMSAQVSQTMEAERMGERFSLIEPPQLPEKPAKPNRLAIMMLGSVLSFAVSIGSVTLSESLDTTIRGRNAIIRLLQVPPLAAIPVILTEQDKRRLRLRRIALSLGFVLVVTVMLVAVNYLYKPLDVLWYTALNRLGIQGPG